MHDSVDRRDSVKASALLAVVQVRHTGGQSVVANKSKKGKTEAE